MRTRCPHVVLMALLVISASPVYATDFDFSGNFTLDNDVVFFNFVVGAPSTVTIFSSSWLSGEPPMGFDPMLGIWQADGTLVQFQDDGGVTGTTLSNGVPYNHGVWDSFFQVLLPAGNYIATVTQYNNFNAGLNLADGFVHDGNPDFTADFPTAVQALFNGVWDNDDGRTSNWAFHLLNVESAVQPTPEPATWLLLAASGLLLAKARRRSR